MRYLLERRRLLASLATLAIGLGVLVSLFPPPATEAVLLNQPARTWMTNGTVYAVARAGSTIYLGGSFSRVGPPTGSLVELDASNGSYNPNWPIFNGPVYAILPDDTGGWYVGGDFTLAGGVPRNRLARVLSTKTIDPSWNPGADGPVYALAKSSTTVYLGGTFSSVAGQARSRLAAVDANTGSLTSWNPAAFPSSFNAVYALAVSGSRVFAGGNFGVQPPFYYPMTNLAVLDASSGIALPAPISANGIVRALALNGTTLYVGGEFTDVGGNGRNRLAAIDTSSNPLTVTPWAPSANDAVYALAVSGGLIFAGGNFTVINGFPRLRFVRIRADNGFVLGEPQATFDSTVRAIVVSGSIAYVGGDFTTVQQGATPRSFLAAIFGVDNLLVTPVITSWDPRADNPVHALALSGSTVIAGGAFKMVNWEARSNLAALSAATGAATPWNPGTDGTVYALAIGSGRLYVGGTFSTVGGQGRQNLAAFNLTDGSLASWNPGQSGYVYALAAGSTALYVGGGFITLGGQPRNYLGALDLTSGAVTPWNPGVGCCFVFALALSGDGSTLYVGGSFPTVGGQGRSNLAAVSTAGTGAVTPWNPGPNNEVYALAVSGSTVYVGGAFSQVGSTPRARLAAVDAASGNLTAWAPNPNGNVYALAVSGGNVYVGGNFTSIVGSNRPYLAAVTPSGNLDSWQPSPNAQVWALAATPNALDVGGAFTTLTNRPRQGYAGFTLQLISFTTGQLTVAPGGTATLSSAVLQASGGFGGTPDTQRYILTAPPTHGTLKLGTTPLSAFSSFTQQDVNSGQVTYQQDGSSTTSDSFTVSATDGIDSSSGPQSVPIAVGNFTPTPSPTVTPTVPPGSTATPTVTPTVPPGSTATPTVPPGSTATPTVPPGSTATPTPTPSSSGGGGEQPSFVPLVTKNG
ncbi:MAG: hypothetical protein KatS3mg061_1018 [Dehalococcoidia bacterium]|nr:MAG: hypothetical protein KatS3mg061_1018 [Dehalococcoidia bacterium]